MVSAVLHSDSDPIWEKPTTHVLGAANAATESAIIATTTIVRTFAHFFMKQPPSKNSCPFPHRIAGEENLRNHVPDSRHKFDGFFLPFFFAFASFIPTISGHSGTCTVACSPGHSPLRTSAAR